MPSSPPANSSGDGNGNGPMYEEVVITGWYPGWLASSFPPSKISWDKWTHMTFAFAYVISFLFLLLSLDVILTFFCI